MAQNNNNNRSNEPFLFPKTNSTVLPNPSNFFSPNLLSTPLPTNSFFQNFVLNNGNQPEYIHPYLIKSSNSSLSVCYPTRTSTSSVVRQVFVPDLTISTPRKSLPMPVSTNPITICHHFLHNFVSQQLSQHLPQVNIPHFRPQDSNGKHVISSYGDLSVTLDIPASSLRFFLVRGSPFLTANVTSHTPLCITTVHEILSFSSNGSLSKHTVKLGNGKTWIIYASNPIKFRRGNKEISSDAFSGIIRIAVLPCSGSKHEAILDKYNSCYPVSGDARLTEPFCVEYKWQKKGKGGLLLLAHPLHLQLLSNDCNNVTILNDFKYRSIDGDLVGVVGDTWLLKTDPISVTWHSIRGVKEECYPEIVSALSKDVKALNSSSIKTNSSYFYGKMIARAARLALIAEEVSYLDVIPAVIKFLKETIEPWLQGTFKGNGFLYEEKWGGIVTKQGSTNAGADFGFGHYNDHHYHLGYFVYAIAVLAKIDMVWGKKYKPQAYALMEDFMNMDKRSNSKYARLRCFDLYKLHSWAGGLSEFSDGRNQESTSEAVNAYYSAALMGIAYDDADLVAAGSTLAAFEIRAAKMWWHIGGGDNLYEKNFTKENRIMGVLWANKRDTGLWFGPSSWKECRLGIQLLPIVPISGWCFDFGHHSITYPISEVLFSDVGFVKELVEWTLPALNREDVGEAELRKVYNLRYPLAMLNLYLAMLCNSLNA
ncbi:hypothetical protein RIF29_14255 [Crotalaria pallida]|uniref:glucan endo-1,3-beta-D-glucosidase n=1 Tax=Crotalaria pallida TaxID=3830 RepID=A0AAN9II31_CROPI